MRLPREQLESYRQAGYLLLPEYFSEAETERIKSEVPALFSEESDRRVVEKDGKTVRAVHGSHLTNETLGRLTRMPRMLEPARQILGGDVYVYQFKINAKAAFLGDVWMWHQDYSFWLHEDGLPEPRVVSIGIFLDEVNEFNGPLIFIPGSHRRDDVDSKAASTTPDAYADSPEWISGFTADLKYTVGQRDVARMAQERGMEAPKGPAGSVILFDGNVVHGSGANISPFSRGMVLVTYSHVDNVPKLGENARPEFLVSRDFSPLEPLARDSLAA